MQFEGVEMNTEQTVTPTTDLRKLSAEVAERVMGWRWFHCVAANGVERNQFYSEGQAETWRSLGWRMTEIPGPPPPDQFNDDTGLPRYSELIEPAMAVVEKLRARRFHVGIGSTNDGWQVSFFALGVKPDCVSAPTLPEAICRAALSLVDAPKETK